jgi:hypothetical protein
MGALGLGTSVSDAEKLLRKPRRVPVVRVACVL